MYYDALGSINHLCVLWMLLSRISKELGHLYFRESAIKFLKEEAFLDSEIVKKQIKAHGSGALNLSASLNSAVC